MIASITKKKKTSQMRWYWELLSVLVRRNLKRRYRGSFLGIYWSLLSPLIMTALYAAIFGTAFAAYYDNSTLNYVLAAFTGLVVINFFSSSTSQALVSVVENGAIVNKIRLPLVIFPLSFIGANVFQLLIGVFPLLLLTTFLISRSLLNVIALLFPLTALILVCAGVSLLMSSLYVFFRDLPYFYELLTFLLWISSPVFYPPEIVPEGVKRILVFNPLLPIINSIRQISLSGSLPDITLIFASLLSGTIVLTVGAISFILWQDKFMDLL
ncbi:Transport permease protein [Hyella patelloides LEGE 07179]|uniref:Transport permease protein n=1 Tax=Hyella patelloides LEGE 07179 TaxID=945734 RepID=A0A563W407_9CYAN|nr:ABC transporter permease [Hyella patelloides]VEP18418.1 Transport permease protein [Hyella patelloides LEGE 07179]